MRDFKKAIEEGRRIARKRPRLHLRASELGSFIDQIREQHYEFDAIYDAIVNAYLAGLAIGIRNGKKSPCMTEITQGQEKAVDGTHGLTT